MDKKALTNKRVRDRNWKWNESVLKCVVSVKYLNNYWVVKAMATNEL